MDIDDDTVALLHLVLAGGRTAPRRRLLQGCGTPGAALAAGPSRWRDAGLDADQIAVLQATAQPSTGLQRCLNWLRNEHSRLLGWHDPDYPPALRQLPQPPVAVFVQGRIELVWQPALAIIGSRAATADGRLHAEQFARELAGQGLVIVSGLAAGIDAAAHAGALQAGAGGTVAVLGAGPDIPYPASNAALHADIGRHGVLLSEFPPGTRPLRDHFPRRNRLIAGLCMAVVVVEAAERSGALITARLAADLGRDVLAVPGSVRNALTRGCHHLIREGAQLVQSSEDVMQAVAARTCSLARELQQRLDEAAFPQPGLPAADSTVAAPDSFANDDCRRVWQALGHDPVEPDTLVQRTNLPAADVTSALLLLELQGHVQVEHGRCSRGGTRSACPRP